MEGDKGRVSDGAAISSTGVVKRSSSSGGDNKGASFSFVSGPSVVSTTSWLMVRCRLRFGRGGGGPVAAAGRGTGAAMGGCRGGGGGILRGGTGGTDLFTPLSATSSFGLGLSAIWVPLKVRDMDPQREPIPIRDRFG